MVVVRVVWRVVSPILVMPRGDSVTLVHCRCAAVGAGDTVIGVGLNILGGMGRHSVRVENMSIGDMISS